MAIAQLQTSLEESRNLLGSVTSPARAIARPGGHGTQEARSVDDVDQCAGPGCARPLNRPATGRPAKYCGDNCRQAAHREKVRAAQAERERAEQLAAAKAATARLWRPLEEAGFHDVAGHAALVVS